MSDNKVTLDQLDNSAVEAMSSSVGDVSMLNTENKTIVGALAEIVGKKEIANAIGEPLAETDKFTEMSSEINGLLSTFKTNMMNAGVVVESGDKFKALIDKIKGLTEGEGNKGIQYANGNGTISSLPYKSSGYQSYVINTNLDFTPTVLFWTVESLDYKGEYGTKTDWKLYETANSLINVSSSTCLKCTLSDLAYDCNFYLSNINSESFTLNYNIELVSYSDAWTENVVYHWYTIGVGEEDTTLRDSLASILTEEGVNVTEEDDMASLIGKVDEEFNEKNNEINEISSILTEKGLMDEGGTVEDVITTLTNFTPARVVSGEAYTLVDCGSTGNVFGGGNVTKTYTIKNLPGCKIESLLIKAKANAEYNSYDGWEPNGVNDELKITHERNGEVLKVIREGASGQFLYGVGWNFNMGVIDGDIKNNDIIRIYLKCDSSSNKHRISLSDIKIMYNITL